MSSIIFLLSYLCDTSSVLIVIKPYSCMIWGELFLMKQFEMDYAFLGPSSLRVDKMLLFSFHRERSRVFGSFIWSII